VTGSEMEPAPSPIRVETEVRIRHAVLEDLQLLATWNAAVDRVVAPTLARQVRGEALVLLAMIGPWPCGHLLVDFTKRPMQVRLRFGTWRCRFRTKASDRS
jgi:hypothetical protein